MEIVNLVALGHGREFCPKMMQAVRKLRSTEIATATKIVCYLLMKAITR
jgi:hypothetical protein